MTSAMLGVNPESFRAPHEPSKISLSSSMRRLARRSSSFSSPSENGAREEKMGEEKMGEEEMGEENERKEDEITRDGLSKMMYGNRRGG